MTDALAGWVCIGTATILTGNFLGELAASRRAGRKERAQNWQWLAIAALQVFLGVRFVTTPSPHDGFPWWLVAAALAVLTWMLITDVGPWLRSRLARPAGK